MGFTHLQQVADAMLGWKDGNLSNDSRSRYLVGIINAIKVKVTTQRNTLGLGMLHLRVLQCCSHQGFLGSLGQSWNYWLKKSVVLWRCISLGNLSMMVCPKTWRTKSATCRRTQWQSIQTESLTNMFGLFIVMLFPHVTTTNSMFLWASQIRTTN